MSHLDEMGTKSATCGEDSRDISRDFALLQKCHCSDIFEVDRSHKDHVVEGSDAIERLKHKAQVLVEVSLIHVVEGLGAIERLKQLHG
ncbi:MAG: hypothetical protein ACXVDN_07775 [Ktedonobacteraceae bacterium]